VKSFFSEARKPLPTNIYDLIYRLVKGGLLMESPSANGKKPKEYILTHNGEDCVNNMLSKQSKTRKSSFKPRKPQKQKKDKNT
jgi:DNA-binding PadR family transcriptional regulator